VKFAEIPKFVINLKKRPERLESVTQEMKYMGWDFELFEGIDLDSHVGCTHSHMGIFDIAEERGYDKVMVIEDDNFFMPYAHDLIDKIESVDFEYDYINLSPTLNRKIKKDDTHPYLHNLSDLSEDPLDKGIFATNCIIYDKKVFNSIRNITGTTMSNGRYFYAIDSYIWKYIIPEYKCYSPILPLSTQKNYYSDVSGGKYNNFYMQTYSWQNRATKQIPKNLTNQHNCQEIKNENTRIKLDF
jgi:GR25 family glycosyltransferase involved in LPS biosynthesis